MRKIIFIGNCQTRLLQELYAEAFAYRTNDTTQFLFPFDPFTDQMREMIRSADVIVSQELDSDVSVDFRLVDTKAQVILFPNVTGVFLWPFSGVSHLHAKRLPYFWQGGYGHQFGDRWLNRKMEAGVAPADIVEEYLDLDVTKVINLERLHELHVDRARQRDERTGFDIVPEMERLLPEQPLFINSGGLELPLFRKLTKGVYSRLGVPEAEIDRVMNAFWRSPMPMDDAPIHPSVARHFGMKFITPETRYRTWTGERLTFREWVDRYVRGDWNDRLLTATNRASRIGRFDADAISTLDQIQRELEATSGSDTGYATLAHLLLLKGDEPAAFAMMQRLEEFDPSNPSAPINVAHLLAQRGELEEAERRGTAVTERWPGYSEVWLRLAIIRERRENGPGAIEAIERAIKLEPRKVQLLAHYAWVAHRFGAASDAFRPFHEAIALDPRNVSLHTGLARTALNHARFPEALAAIDRAIQLEPANTGLLREKANILIRSGDPAAAEAEYAQAVTIEPGNGQLHEARAGLQVDLGQYDKAIESSRLAVRTDRTRSPLLGQLADRLIKLDRFAEAGKLYRDAIEHDWKNVELIGGLARSLHRQGDIAGAVLALHRTIQLAPEDSRWHSLLAEILMEHGDFGDAAEVLANATVLAPTNGTVLAAKARLLIEQGELAAALDAAEAAVAMEPANPDVAARMAFVVTKTPSVSRAPRPVLTAETGLDLMHQFYSIGGDCEFGVFQGTFDYRPNNLLKNAGTPVDALIDILNNGLANLTDPAVLRPAPGLNGQDSFMMHNDRYRMQWHAHAPDGGHNATAAIEREARMMNRLGELFLEEIASDTRILVRKALPGETPEDGHRLYDALTAHCKHVRLMCVAAVAKPTPAEWDGRILRGNLRWTPEVPDPKNIDRSGWIELCQIAAGASWPV